MQTSVRTAITVSSGVIAGRHLVVFLVIFFLQLVQTSVRTAITVSTGVIAGRHLAVLLVILFGCLVVISLCFLQLVQTSVNTGVVVWLACCHFVVFLAARADVCENR